jgi:glutaredoxin
MTTANTKTTSTTTKVETISVDPKRLRDTDNAAVWTVIGLKNCPWTLKAVELLKEHGEEVKHLVMTKEWHRRLLIEFNCKRSPAVFKGAQYFGSYTEIENYYKCWFFSDNELL